MRLNQTEVLLMNLFIQEKVKVQVLTDLDNEYTEVEPPDDQVEGIMGLYKKGLVHFVPNLDVNLQEVLN